MSLSNSIRHFFHVVSNVRPIYWICLYIGLMPVFAFIYWLLPDSQFRIPDNGTTDFGSWVYYSIVTISTLGFGDYTPVHGWAQAITAIEVMCGLVILGLFLNAVGSMKSEIEVESEIERQRQIHLAREKEKLAKNAPLIIHKINLFLAYCYAVTTPVAKRTKDSPEYNSRFAFSDIRDLYKPSDIPADYSRRSSVEGLMRCAMSTSLYIDSLQTRIDMTLWPRLLEDCFSFVANTQLFSSSDLLKEKLLRMAHDENISLEAAEQKISDEIATCGGIPENGKDDMMTPLVELYHYIKDNAVLARDIEVTVTGIVS